MQKAVIYARYSSDNQDDATIETQLRECRNKAKALDSEVIREYTDIAQSGRSDNRLQFKQMLADAKLKNFQVVIVRKFDRFARNVVDARLTEQHLNKYGVKLLSVHETFDDSTTAGWFSKQMVHLVNEWYSKNLAVETISGMETNTRKGFRCGGTAPYGYKNVRVLDKSTGKIRTKLEPDPQESEAISYIFKRYAAGLSFNKIIKEIEERNFKPRRAKKWSKSQISQMLRNETYLGILTWRKTPDPETWIRNKGAVPQLIDDATWKTVQARMDYNPSKSIRGKGSTHPLTGHVKCKVCGKNYVIKSKQKGRWRLYCSGHLKKECDNQRSVFEDVLIEKVKNVLLSEIFTEQNIYDAIKELKKEISTDYNKPQKQISQLRFKLKQIEDKQTKLAEELASGDIPREVVKRAISKLEDGKNGLLRRIRDVEDEIEAQKNFEISSQDLKDFSILAKYQVENATDSVLKGTLKRFCVIIEIGKTHAQVKVSLPFSKSDTDMLSHGYKKISNSQNGSKRTVSPLDFRDDTDIVSAGDARLNISVLIKSRPFSLAT